MSSEILPISCALSIVAVFALAGIVVFTGTELCYSMLATGFDPLVWTSAY